MVPASVGTFQPIITSEHSRNRIPSRFQHLFQHEPRILETHRAWDPGVQHLEAAFQKHLRQPIVRGEVSRLLIELNRSEHHPRLFSEFTQQLSLAELQWLKGRYYHPYRDQVVEYVEEQQTRFGWCLHLSLHSFTPIWNGETRQADIAVLYDPQRIAEKELAGKCIEALKNLGAGIQLRRNYPYRGTADGLTTSLRKQFRNYLGLELEVNQKGLLGPAGKKWGTRIAEVLWPVLTNLKNPFLRTCRSRGPRSVR